MASVGQIGDRVSKLFQLPDGSEEWFEGEIVKVVRRVNSPPAKKRKGAQGPSAVSTTVTYHIAFDDGDEAEFEEAELQEALEDFKVRGQAVRTPEAQNRRRSTIPGADKDMVVAQVEPKTGTGGKSQRERLAATPGPSAPAAEDTMTPYEKQRAENMKRNKLKLLELEVDKAAQQIVQEVVAKPSEKKRKRARPDADSLLAEREQRASGRLAGKAPVRYNEAALDAAERRADRSGPRAPRLERLQTEEGYTTENEEALGTFVTPWECKTIAGGWRPRTAEDAAAGKKGPGMGGNMVRIMDKVNGTTCHQCRQKALGTHTECTQCRKYTGQFCGDCLWQRYGENVDEALANPEWACPVCRDICNCSSSSCLRAQRGWGATGALYPEAKRKGFASVAHYIILTKRAKKKEEEEAAAVAAAAAAETTTAAV